MSMEQSKVVPVVVGVGDIKNSSKKLEDAKEPLELILEAIHTALQDTGVLPSLVREVQSSIDSVDIVATWTWPYPDLPGLISERLGVQPSHKYYSGHGGNSPGKLFDDAARRISLGENKFAIVAGGEALASRMYGMLL